MYSISRIPKGLKGVLTSVNFFLCNVSNIGDLFGCED